MDRHAGVVLCGPFARPAIHAEKPQEFSASGTSIISAEPVTFLERQHAHVRPRYPTWTDRLAESLGGTCYPRMYEGWVQQRGFAAQGNSFGSSVFRNSVLLAQGINLLASVSTRSVPK